MDFTKAAKILLKGYQSSWDEKHSKVEWVGPGEFGENNSQERFHAFGVTASGVPYKITYELRPYGYHIVTAWKASSSDLRGHSATLSEQSRVPDRGAKRQRSTRHGRSERRELSKRASTRRESKRARSKDD